MDRDHEFTIPLPGDGIYVIQLLAGVQIEHSDGATVGRWPAFDLEVRGDSEADVYQKLLGGLQQQIGGDPGSAAFKPFEATCARTARGYPRRTSPPASWRSCAR